MLTSRLPAHSMKFVALLSVLFVVLATQKLKSEKSNVFVLEALNSSCQPSTNGTRSDGKNGYCSESGSNSRATGRNDWFMDYYDEQADGFELRIVEESFDERLANMIYTLNAHKVFETDFFSFSSGDPELDLKNMQAVAGPEVSGTDCNKDLSQMVSLLDDMKHRLDSKRLNQSKKLNFDERHFRLARILDSFGRYEPGYMSGRTRSIGQFDQCVSTKMLLGERDPQSNVGNQQAPVHKVETRYCWVRLNIRKHLNPALENSLRSDFGQIRHRILVGACLPKSCHSKTLIKNVNRDNHELVQKLVHSQFKLPDSIYLDENLEIGEIYCLVDRDSPHSRLPFSGQLVLIFLIGWLMLTIYASKWRASHQQAGCNETAPLFSSIMDCLDIRESVHDFFGYSDSSLSAAELEKRELMQKDRRVDLSALDPVKVIGCCFVVLGHSLVIQSSFIQDPLKTYFGCMLDPAILFATIGTSVVDLFMVITGILMGYIFMKRANATASKLGKQKSQGVATSTNGRFATRFPVAGTKQNQLKLFLNHWVKFTLNRHLVLVPLYFLVFWFKKSVFISHMADRPLWDAGFNRDTAAGSCEQESWFSPFTMASAFTPLNRQCLPQSWSVSADLFFSLVIAPVLLLMPSRPKLALFIGVIVALASNVSATMAFYAVEPMKKRAFDEMRFDAFTSLFGNLHHLYTYPHFRLSTILVGVMAGYFLFKHERDKSDWPDWFRRIATRAALISLLQVILLFTSLPYWKPFVHPYEFIFFTSAFNGLRVIFAVTNAILLLRVATDWSHTFMLKYCTDRFWRSMVKLNYAILLIHVDVLIYVVGSGTTYSYFSKRNLMANFAAAYLYCIPLAMFLHVVYENPFNKLAKRHLITLLDR